MSGRSLFRDLKADVTEGSDLCIKIPTILRMSFVPLFTGPFEPSTRTS